MKISINKPCDRCGNAIDGFMEVTDDGCIIMTAGFYEMSGWEAMRDQEEQIVCDVCMHNDPRYIEIFGKVSS